jgi:hypothetical protein
MLSCLCSYNCALNDAIVESGFDVLSSRLALIIVVCCSDVTHFHLLILANEQFHEFENHEIFSKRGMDSESIHHKPELLVGNVGI